MPVVMSSAAKPVEIIPGHRESHSGVDQKPFAFPPESLFAFSQESCSSSPRNRFHVHPGIPFALPRNPVRLAPESPTWGLCPQTPGISRQNWRSRSSAAFSTRPTSVVTSWPPLARL